MDECLRGHEIAPCKARPVVLRVVVEALGKVKRIEKHRADLCKHAFIVKVHNTIAQALGDSLMRPFVSLLIIWMKVLIVVAYSRLDEYKMRVKFGRKKYASTSSNKYAKLWLRKLNATVYRGHAVAIPTIHQNLGKQSIYERAYSELPATWAPTWRKNSSAYRLSLSFKQCVSVVFRGAEVKFVRGVHAFSTKGLAWMESKPLLACFESGCGTRSGTGCLGLALVLGWKELSTSEGTTHIS